MSHHTLQRTLVRMQFDPAWAHEVVAAPAKELQSLDLTDVERRYLSSVDERALRVDPLLRRRTLRIIADEFKITTTLALAETRSLAFAESFFASPQFHAAVEGDHPIVLAFGEFVSAAIAEGRLRTPQLPAVLALEVAMAGCRRPRPIKGVVTTKNLPAKRMQRAPGVDVVRLPAHTVETVQAVERYLFEVGLMPQVALCDDAPPMAVLPATSEEWVELLLTPNGNQFALSWLGEIESRILAAAAEPVYGATLLSTGRNPKALVPIVRGYLDAAVLIEIA